MNNNDIIPVLISIWKYEASWFLNNSWKGTRPGSCKYYYTLYSGSEQHAKPV